MNGIYVDGQKVIDPGVISKITTSGVEGGPADTGIVAILQESGAGGEPLVAQVFTSGAAMRGILSDFDAKVLGKLLFAPSKSERVPKGASRVIVVRVNPATQGALTVLDANARAAVAFTAKDYGLAGNNTRLTIGSGTTSGKKLTVVGASTEVFDNIGYLPAFTAKYTADGVHTVAAMTLAVDPNATGASPAVTIAFSIERTGGLAAFNPSAWMAFDGALHFAFGAPGSEKTITVTGVDKATGLTKTEILTIGAAATSKTSDTAWSDVTSIDISGMPATTVTITGNAFALTAAAYPKLSNLRDRITSIGRGFALTLLTTRSSLEVSNLDYTTAADVNGVTATFNAHLYHFVAGVASTQINAARAAAARNLPASSGPTNLSGGADNTASQSDWEAGFRVLEELEVNIVVPLTGDDAVHDALAAHNLYMWGEGRSERMGIVGVPEGTYLDDPNGGTGLYQRTAALNAANVALVGQRIKTYDDTGAIVTLPPWYTAALLAGCEAGRKPTSSTTWSTVDVQGVLDEPTLSNPSGGTGPWTVRANRIQLIEHGVTVLRLKPGTSQYMWARDVTTYQEEDNAFKQSFFCWMAVGQSVKNVRRRLEFAIGDGSATMTTGMAEALTKSELKRQKNGREIVDYTPTSVKAQDLGNGFDVPYEFRPPEARYFIVQRANATRQASGG